MATARPDSRHQVAHPLRVRHLVLAVVAGSAVLAVGVLGGMAATWDAPPAVLAPAPSQQSAPVTQRQFDDSQLVSLQLSPGPPRALQAPGAGRVTAFGCAVGATLTSGASSLSLDGAPELNLATSMPLWRDLALRTKGADVAALAGELARLGFLAAPTDTVTQAVLDAWDRAEAAIGAPVRRPGSPIPAGRVLWLPTDGIAFTSCGVSVGDTVAPGQQVAGLAPTLAGARLVAQPGNAAPGDHVLTLGGHSFTLTRDGALADPAQLDALASLPAVGYALAPGGAGQVSGTYSLAEPLTVSVVPPAAVVTGPDGASCVLGDGRPMPVRIIGSQLGTTFVTFDGTPPQLVSTTPPRDLTCT